MRTPGPHLPLPCSTPMPMQLQSPPAIASISTKDSNRTAAPHPEVLTPETGTGTIAIQYLLLHQRPGHSRYNGGASPVANGCSIKCLILRECFYPVLSMISGYSLLTR